MPPPAGSERRRARRSGPLWVALIACLWLNQSVGLVAWQKVRYGVFTDPGAHVIDAARYPFIFLYRRSADEAMYYGTAAQILGQPYDREVVALHTRGRVPGLAGFESPPPLADGRWHMPWVEVPLEYPPPLLPFVLVPKLVTTGFERYARVFGLLMGLCMVGAIALAIDLAPRAHAARAQIEARWWLGAGLLLALGALTIQRLDPIVALLMIAMVRGAARRSPRQFGLWAGLAGACKIVPLLVVPVVLAADWTFWRARVLRLGSLAAWMAAGLAVGFGPMFLASRGAFIDLFRYHGERGLQVESTLGALLGAVRALCGASSPATISYGSFNLDGPVPDLLAKLALPITLAGIAALTALERRAPTSPDAGVRAGEDAGEPARIARITRAALGATVIVWLGGKVFSPQYLTWGIPLVLAIPGRRGTVAIWIAVVALALTQLYFRGYYDLVYDQRFAGVFTVLLRQAVLVGLLVFVTRRRPPPGPVLPLCGHV
jgi:hypothetical protein